MPLPSRPQQWCDPASLVQLRAFFVLMPLANHPQMSSRVSSLVCASSHFYKRSCSSVGLLLLLLLTRRVYVPGRDENECGI